MGQSSIFNHRSIRKYLPNNVDDALLNRILEAGIRASNTGNMQVYSIVVTRDQHLREQLWEAHFKQDMVKQAPVHLTFCVDINRFSHWCVINNASPGYDNFLWFLNGAIDAVLASQNISIEAENNGLGICYLGTAAYNADKIIEILKLPRGVIPVTAIVMGYPAETPELTDRLPLEAVVHFDTYQNYSDSIIRELYSAIENSDLAKRLIAENQVANFATIFTEKRYKKTDNQFFSQKYLKILEQQGFMNNF
ncbi:MAG TPA: nitroreductase family protein [Salinivirgaceae bacterium]|nr:nitroreductase family protein [Salinivirgaceae bacterium]